MLVTDHWGNLGELVAALHPHLFDTDKETINTSIRYGHRNNSHIFYDQWEDE